MAHNSSVGVGSLIGDSPMRLPSAMREPTSTEELQAILTLL